MHRAYLSLGSNMQPQRHMALAIAAMRETFGEVTVSPVYRTPAVGFAGADFLNAAALVRTAMTPQVLNDWLHALEERHGRDRSGPRFGDRPLDIDIVLFDDLVLDGPGHLRLPRPELVHAFVLKPLADIAPEVSVPGTGLTLGQLWQRHADVDAPFETVTLPPP